MSRCPVIEIHAWYRKQQLTSRTWIDHPSGPIALSIPVERRSRRAPISKKKVDYQEDWPETHLRSIRNAYRNSPYFELFETEVEAFFQYRHELLVNWLKSSYELVMRLSGMRQSVIWSAAYIEKQEAGIDLREEFGAGYAEASSTQTIAEYPHMFESDGKGLSILDLLFMTGPEAERYLQIQAE